MTVPPDLWRYAPGSADPPLVPLPEAIALHRLVQLCPYRSTTGCGCTGARCGLRSAALVSHRDCLECVRIYG